MAPLSLVARSRAMPISLAFVLGFLGCDRENEQAPSPPRQKPSAQAPAKPPPPPAPWFVGTWRGSARLEAKLAPPLAEREALGRKIEDPPRLTDEKLPVELQVDEQRRVSGTIDGKGRVYGLVEDETLRAQLVYPLAEPPTKASEIRRGVLIGRREGQAFATTLKMSSGDSSSVFHGPLRLEKATEKTTGSAR